MRTRTTAAPTRELEPRSLTGPRSFDVTWLSICIGGFLLLCWLLRRFVTDDAWITVRYAENLADGRGFVWNPGGPRVEGFSNPLLVGVESLAHWLGLPAIDAARALGVACGVALLVVMHALGRAVVGNVAARVALGLTAFSAPVALWAVGGLETLPTVLATTAGVLLLIRATTRGQVVRAGLVLAVLPWLRPEGVVIAFAIAVVAEAPALLRARDRRGAIGRLALAAGPALVSFALLEAARLVIYGHLLPNSVLYKAGNGGAFDVLARFGAEAAPLIVAAGLGLCLARGRQRLLVVPVAVYAVGSIGTLDSVNHFNRFLLPTWPQLALLAGLGVAAACRRAGRRERPVQAFAAVASATAVVALGVTSAPQASSFANRYATCAQAARSDAAGWLRADTPAGTTFSVSDAGLLPARSGGRTAVDDFLLNDPIIQRTGALPAPRRVDLLLRRRPQVMFLLSTNPHVFRPKFLTDGLLRRDPRFREYALAHVARGGGQGCNYNLFAYRRR